MTYAHWPKGIWLEWVDPKTGKSKGTQFVKPSKKLGKPIPPLK